VPISVPGCWRALTDLFFPGGLNEDTVGYDRRFGFTIGSFNNEQDAITVNDTSCSKGTVKLTSRLVLPLVLHM
jgi:hypothetical protein